jgi:hypothetical protein
MLRGRRKSPPDIERKLALSLSAPSLLILQAEIVLRTAPVVSLASLRAEELPFRANRGYREISPSSAFVEERNHAALYS